MTLIFCGFVLYILCLIFFSLLSKLEFGWVNEIRSPHQVPNVEVITFWLQIWILKALCLYQNPCKNWKYAEILQPDSATVNHSEWFLFLHGELESYSQFKIFSVCFLLGIPWVWAHYVFQRNTCKRRYNAFN